MSLSDDNKVGTAARPTSPCLTGAVAEPETFITVVESMYILTISLCKHSLPDSFRECVCVRARVGGFGGKNERLVCIQEFLGWKGGGVCGIVRQLDDADIDEVLSGGAGVSAGCCQIHGVSARFTFGLWVPNRRLGRLGYDDWLESCGGAA